MGSFSYHSRTRDEYRPFLARSRQSDGSGDELNSFAAAPASAAD